jgi:hypothetical protein
MDEMWMQEPIKKWQRNTYLDAQNDLLASHKK